MDSPSIAQRLRHDKNTVCRLGSALVGAHGATPGSVVRARDELRAALMSIDKVVDANDGGRLLPDETVAGLAEWKRLMVVALDACQDAIDFAGGRP